MEKHLSETADYLISAFEEEEGETSPEKKLTVNHVVSEVASWYEKLRNAMDYREEEVVLRAAIERILKRRTLLGGSGEKIAHPLIRELLWARYFPDASVPEAIIEEVASSIDLYFRFRAAILESNKLPENVVFEWVYNLLSSDIALILSPSREKEIMAAFMYQMERQQIQIPDENEQVRDAQVFIAIRKSFAKDDIAFLRYHLFNQFFGRLTTENKEQIALRFTEGYKEIERQLSYPLRQRIFTYIKKQSPPFLILEDILKQTKGNLRELLDNQEFLESAIIETCATKYQGINAKVRRAILRSFIFILFTKAFFAFSIEGTYESILFGKVMWENIAINALIPPLLMILVGILIRTPGEDNTKRIAFRIKSLLFDEHPNLGLPLLLKITPDKNTSLLHIVFSTLWFLAFGVSFGGIIWLLTVLQFNIISQGVFIFFIAIVSFLAYRINASASEYNVESKQGWATPVIDFFFLPIIHVGRHLAEGVSQINILLFILDFIIETPFKGMFGFFEQLFLYLHTKREDLG